MQLFNCFKRPVSSDFDLDLSRETETTYIETLDERGHIKLKKVGVINISEKINEYAPTVDLSLLVQNAKNGLLSFDELAFKEGDVGDISNVPNLLDIYNKSNIDNIYDDLPDSIKNKYSSSDLLNRDLQSVLDDYVNELLVKSMKDKEASDNG